MSLTADQQHIHDCIIDKKRGRFTIVGYAGTGKSYLVSHIINSLLKSGKTIKILAPTHKALEVLLSKDKSRERLYSTVTSFLSLKPDYDNKEYKHDSPVFMQQGKDKPIPNVLIVDECSMIDNKTYDRLTSLPVEKLIFVGDDAQLPSVENEGMLSKSFDPSLQQILSLTEILRTDKNDIIDLSMMLRSRHWKDIYSLKSSENIEIVKQNDYDFSCEKELCYTNKSVNAMNIAHKMKTNPSDSVISEGDVVTFYQNVYKGNYLVFNNSESQKIVKIQEPTLPGEKSSPFMLYTAEQGVIFKVCKEEAFELFKKKYVQLYDESRWRELSDFTSEVLIYKELYHHIPMKKSMVIKRTFDLNYAMTIHKSQGSTFDSAAIMLKDIYGDDCQKLLYTAVTRSKDKIVLLK